MNQKPKMPISNYTIVIRCYGVDSPEIAKGKNKIGQPFGEKAKQFTTDLTYHKIVQVKMLGKDKYNRILGEVETLQAQDLSLELVSRGLATMYTGSGAKYDVSVSYGTVSTVFLITLKKNEKVVVFVLRKDFICMTKLFSNHSKPLEINKIRENERFCR